MTEEEKADWDRIVEIRDGYHEECDWLVAEIEKAEDAGLREVLKRISNGTAGSPPGQKKR